MILPSGNFQWRPEGALSAAILHRWLDMSPSVPWKRCSTFPWNSPEKTLNYFLGISRGKRRTIRWKTRVIILWIPPKEDVQLSVASHKKDVQQFLGISWGRHLIASAISRGKLFIFFHNQNSEQEIIFLEHLVVFSELAAHEGDTAQGGFEFAVHEHAWSLWTWFLATSPNWSSGCVAGHFWC